MKTKILEMTQEKRYANRFFYTRFTVTSIKSKKYPVSEMQFHFWKKFIFNVKYIFSKLYGNCAFPQNKWGENSAFYAVFVIIIDIVLLPKGFCVALFWTLSQNLESCTGSLVSDVAAFTVIWQICLQVSRKSALWVNFQALNHQTTMAHIFATLDCLILYITVCEWSISISETLA